RGESKRGGESRPDAASGGAAHGRTLSMGARTAGQEAVMTARLVNAHDVPIKLYLEPWGEEYEMPPAAVFEVVARGPAGDSLEVTVAHQQITVWGWPGSVVTLSREGAELGAGSGPRSPVPAMPALSSARPAAPRANAPGRRRG